MTEPGRNLTCGSVAAKLATWQFFDSGQHGVDCYGSVVLAVIEPFAFPRIPQILPGNNTLEPFGLPEVFQQAGLEIGDEVN
jgi:hypothetical protein